MKLYSVFFVDFIGLSGFERYISMNSELDMHNIYHHRQGLHDTGSHQQPLLF